MNNPNEVPMFATGTTIIVATHREYEASSTVGIVQCNKLEDAVKYINDQIDFYNKFTSLGITTKIYLCNCEFATYNAIGKISVVQKHDSTRDYLLEISERGLIVNPKHPNAQSFTTK